MPMNMTHAESAYLDGRVQWLEFWEGFISNWMEPLTKLIMMDMRDVMEQTAMVDPRAGHLQEVLEQSIGGQYASNTPRMATSTSSKNWLSRPPLSGE